MSKFEFLTMSIYFSNVGCTVIYNDKRRKLYD